MAITNYTELKSRLATWIERNDLQTTEVEECIAFAEARFNRLLKSVRTETTLTGTVGSRAISISSLSMIEPVSLKVTDSDGDERGLILKPHGVLSYIDDTDEPSFYEINGTNIKFDVMLDQAYSFRFVYQGRFALSDSVPTNALLTDHPDVYLAASIVWSSLLVEDDPRLSKYKAVLEEGLPEVQHLYAQKDRTVLTVEPMFASLGRNAPAGYNGDD